MSPMHDGGWWATGLIIDLGTSLLLGLSGRLENGALEDARRRLEEGARSLQHLASRGGRMAFGEGSGAHALWSALRADVAGYLGAAAPGGVPPVPPTVKGALEEAAAQLTAGLEALPSREAGSGERLASLLTTLSALGWWCWSQECGQGVLQWRPVAGGRPDWEQLSCGLIACAADLARLEATLRNRVRPARHPLSRIVVHLRRHQQRVQAVMEGTAELLRFLATGAGNGDGGEGPALPAAFLERVALELAWQRLTWARSLMASLHRRLVYLPAGEVEPVVYTVLEDVLAGLDPGAQVTLTAVPATTALRGLHLWAGNGEPGLGWVDGSLFWDEVDGEDAGGILPMAVQDLGNPLVWPLMARAYSLSYPRPAVLRSALAQGLDASILADLVGLTAFGPSYLMAIAAGVAGRWPLLGGDELPRRLEAMGQELARQGLEDPSVTRWVEAMVALRPPFVASAAASRGESRDASPEARAEAPADWTAAGDVLRTALAQAGLQPYGPAQARMAHRLVEGLADGQLISGVRLGAGVREPAAGEVTGNHSLFSQGPAVDREAPEGNTGRQAVGWLYHQLRQVQDMPAGSAEILHAGWLFVTGLLTQRMQDRWLKGGAYPPWSWSDVAGQLAGTDAILLRSLDVAAVHRLYVQEVARFDP